MKRKVAPLNLRLTVAHRAWLEREAAKNGRSLTAEIEARLDEAIEYRRQNPPPWWDEEAAK